MRATTTTKMLVLVPFASMAACLGSGVGPGGQSYATIVLTDEPAAYWRFEETSGPVATDASGHNRPGFFLNGPLLGANVGATRTGSAIALQNESDGVFVEYATWTNLPALTVEAWVRPTRVTEPEGVIIVDKGNTWNLFLDPAGRPGFQFPGDVPPETLASAPVVAGETYHLVGTVEGGEMKLYVNGALLSEAAVPPGIPARNTPIHIGRGLGPVRWEFYGVIDEVALYDRALSASAILAHYNAGK
jgi:hypothetical protein